MGCTNDWTWCFLWENHYLWYIYIYIHRCSWWIGCSKQIWVRGTILQRRDFFKNVGDCRSITKNIGIHFATKSNKTDMKWFLMVFVLSGTHLKATNLKHMYIYNYICMLYIHNICKLLKSRMYPKWYFTNLSLTKAPSSLQIACTIGFGANIQSIPGQTILYSKHAQNIDLWLAKEGKPNNKLKHPINRIRGCTFV